MLEPGSYVAVTCSPSKGVDVTLDMSARLAHRGFKVVPHVAAKMVRNKRHLHEIIARLNDLPIIPIYVYVSKHLVKPWVGGYTANIMDHHYSKNLSIVQ